MLKKYIKVVKVKGDYKSFFYKKSALAETFNPLHY